MEETILYRVYLNPAYKQLSWFEVYNLYSKPKEFFNRFSNPDREYKNFRNQQREFLNASNTFRFDAFGKVFFIQFMFDTTPEYRQAIIENMPNLKRVNINE